MEEEKKLNFLTRLRRNKLIQIILDVIIIAGTVILVSYVLAVLMLGIWR